MEDRLAEIESLRLASGINPPVTHTEYVGEDGWIDGGIGEAATPGVYFAASASRPAGDYIVALLNNAEWLTSRLRAAMAVVNAERERAAAEKLLDVANDEFIAAITDEEANYTATALDDAEQRWLKAEEAVATALAALEADDDND